MIFGSRGTKFTVGPGDSDSTLEQGESTVATSFFPEHLCCTRSSLPSRASGDSWDDGTYVEAPGEPGKSRDVQVNS